MHGVMQACRTTAGQRERGGFTRPTIRRDLSSSCPLRLPSRVWPFHPLTGMHGFQRVNSTRRPLKKAGPPSVSSSLFPLPPASPSTPSRCAVVADRLSPEPTDAYFAVGACLTTTPAVIRPRPRRPTARLALLAWSPDPRPPRLQPAAQETRPRGGEQSRSSVIPSAGLGGPDSIPDWFRKGSPPVSDRYARHFIRPPKIHR